MTDRPYCAKICARKIIVIIMSEENTDLTELHDQWNLLGRYYVPGCGSIEVDGEDLQYEVHEFDLGNGSVYHFNSNVDAGQAERLIHEGRHRGVKPVQRGKETSDEFIFPTKKRIVTEVTPNFDEENDLTVIVCPGWGETTAQFEHDFLLVELKEAQRAGYSNPRIIGINAVGRGSDEYVKNSDRCVSVGMLDEIDDVEFLTRLLDARGHIGEKVVIVGHSMGYLSAMGVADSLSAINNVREESDEVRRNVQSIVALMPATDQPRGLWRPRFVWTVRKQVIPAVSQVAKGTGSLALPYAEHERIMFSGEIEKNAGKNHWLRGNPDSARRFLGATFNVKRQFNVDEILEGTRFHVFGGHKDNLIPRGMVLNAADYLDSAARTVGGSLEFGMDFAHSIPLQLSEAQDRELS